MLRRAAHRPAAHRLAACRLAVPRLAVDRAAAWLGCALLAPILAAEGIRSPSQTLALPENRLELLTAAGPGRDDGRYLFRRTTGEEEALELRLAAGAPEELVPGSRWWVGYTELKRQPPDPRTFVRDPDGPRVLLLEGVGPALFPGSAAVGRVLAAPGPEEGDAATRAEEALEAAIELLAAPEEDLRLLAASEVGLEVRLWEALTPGRLSALGRVFATSAAEPYVRWRLIEAAGGAAAAEIGGAGAAAADWARQALAEADLDPDLHGYEPALQILAIETLAARGEEGDAPSLLRLLRSRHGAVGRAAVFALRDLAPERLRAAAPSLLEDDALSSEARRVLKAVLERLDEEAGT